MAIELICLDADDTLWHNESFFRDSFATFTQLLADHADAEEIQRQLDLLEHRNIPLYGYGVKGFILSMLETAHAVCGERLSPDVTGKILALGRDMMAHPIDLLPGVAEALPSLAKRGALILVTKGDLHHQEAKLAASGIGDAFAGVEIVSDKRADTYHRIFRRYGVDAGAAVMAGNSMRSDILPALEAGAWAAFIPYHLQWAHEAADPPGEHPRYRELASLGELPTWIDALA